MATETPHPLLPGVSIDGHWPFTDKPAWERTTGPWKLGMGADGSVVLWPMAQRFPDELGLVEFAGGTKEELLQFQVVFCRLGYDQDPRLVHQDGAVFIFNWRSYTFAQAVVASWVAKVFFAGDRDGALEIGASFGEMVSNAVREGRIG